MIRRFGLIGVAWGTVIPHVVSTSIVIPLITLRAVNMRWRDYVRKGFVRPVIAALPAMALCCAFSHLVVRPAWLTFGLEVAAIAAASALASYYLCLSAEQRASILQTARMRPVSEMVKAGPGR
jgi:hypothetical protein